MARPQKIGLDYFPLDIDIDQDDKLAIVEAQHGMLGFAIVIKLLMKIYGEGYYYKWTEKEQILFSRRINVDINKVKVIVEDCIKWGMFETESFKNHGVLTSKGIQVRYLEATKRRQKVEIIKELLLLKKSCLKEFPQLVVVNINEVNVDINTQGDEVNDNISTQRKGKERKEDNTSKISEKFHEETIEYKLSELLYKRILENDTKTKTPNIYKWAENIDYLIRLDGRSVEDIRRIIEFATNDDFWKTNVLSTSKLRKQFPTLYLREKESNKEIVKVKSNWDVDAS